MTPRHLVTVAALALAGLAAPLVSAAETRFFRIQVVDEQTGRGVPMVELETVNNVLHVTDSHGLIAFDEPGLMDQQVFFYVRSHGYEYSKDGFGFRGVRLTPKAGASAQIKIRRVNVAERLYRMTGQGIYRDTLLLGEKAPLKNPVLNGGVLGQDSVVNAIYGGKLYWFWGDTNRAAYALGNYRVTGAVSDLPGRDGLDPALGVDLTYFTDDKGVNREMFPSDQPGAIWIFGPMVLREDGREVLATHYGHRYEHGIGVWNDEKKIFEKRAEFPADAQVYPHGQGVQVVVDGERWFYFPGPYPVTRVRAKLEDVLDPQRYEAFTCYEAGGGKDAKIERDGAGRMVWGWKTGAPPPRMPRGLFESPSAEGTGADGLYHLTDVETGKPVRGHGGSVFWNDYRRKWVMVFLEAMGRSMIGEVWYAEADTVLGPWVYARRVVTHDKYSFYNVKQHPYFDQEGGRLIYFEGTYTDFVSGAPSKTPWYDYNQIMYRLDLSDDRLHLPAAVYEQVAAEGGTSYSVQVDPSQAPPAEALVRFYAIPPDRPARGTVPITIGGRLAFHGLPAQAAAGEAENPAVVALYEYRREGHAPRYATQEHAPGEHWQQSEEPICRVWRSPRIDPPRQPQARPVR
jgi:hypothetical protein